MTLTTPLLGVFCHSWPRIWYSLTAYNIWRLSFSHSLDIIGGPIFEMGHVTVTMSLLRLICHSSDGWPIAGNVAYWRHWSSELYCAIPYARRTILHNKRLRYRRETPPPRRSVLLEILAYCCTNNTNRSRVSLRSTFSNCHVLFRNLHTFVQASLN